MNSTQQTKERTMKYFEIIANERLTANPEVERLTQAVVMAEDKETAVSRFVEWASESYEMTAMDYYDDNTLLEGTKAYYEALKMEAIEISEMRYSLLSRRYFKSL